MITLDVGRDARQFLGMPDRSSKRPRDPNQPSQLTVAIATGEADDPILTPDGKNAAAVSLGRRGGLLGGKARAERMSSEERSAVARQAALARWRKTPDAGSDT